MPFLTNKTESKKNVYGKDGTLYRVQPGRSEEVDSETDWKSHPLVKCKALVLGLPSSDELDLDDDDDANQGNSGSDDGETLEGLQAEFKDVAGKDPDKRWGVEKLKEEIEKVLGA
mgnify:CR=1 FL=1